MFHLRKKRPPLGTEESPIWEYAYSEQARVVNGLCHVEQEATRDYLLKIGYELVEEELVAVAPSENGHTDSEPPLPKPRPKTQKKKRWR